MDVLKAAAAGVAAVMLALYVKNVRPEYSTLISIAAGLAIFGFVLVCLKQIVGGIEQLGDYLSINSFYIRILLRVTGIAYICEFASGICKDAGYQAIASQIEMFGKLSIILMSLPVLKVLLETVDTFISG